MNSEDDKENELHRRKKELQERERSIKLRELEAEINQTPLYQSKKHQPPENSLQRWYGKLITVGKFLAIVIAVAVSFKIATSLATIILIGGVAWVAYKLFFESNSSKR
jgi:hypothetical protein